jgi:hypothetical protein
VSHPIDGILDELEMFDFCFHVSIFLSSGAFFRTCDREPTPKDFFAPPAVSLPGGVPTD